MEEFIKVIGRMENSTVMDFTKVLIAYRERVNGEMGKKFDGQESEKCRNTKINKNNHNCIQKQFNLIHSVYRKCRIYKNFENY